MKKYIIGGISDNGTKTPMNQDACYAGVMQSVIGDVVFAVICDGMGGMHMGEIASATLIQEIRKWFDSVCELGAAWIPDIYKIHTEWEDIVDKSNKIIRDYGKEQGLSMGSTLVMLLITPENVIIMNIGDSRAYKISEGMIRLTTDDSVVGHEIEMGLLTEEEAKQDKRNNQLTQCVGILEEVHPHFTCTPVEDAIYFIASDGFYNHLTNPEMIAGLTVSLPETDEQMQDALGLLMRMDRERGECDDITAIAVRVIEKM